MEVPGVDRKDIDIKVEEDTLRIEAHIDYSKYEGMEPLYTEYNVGHFALGLPPTFIQRGLESGG
jgi:HSP20 family protein